MVACFFCSVGQISLQVGWEIV